MTFESSISDFVERSEFDDLSDDVLHEVRRRVIDSIGVALASRNSPPARAARRFLPDYPGRSLLIGGGQASPDIASFYNTLLIRYLDFNDTYLSLEPLHPSDMIGALLSVGSKAGSSCKDMILAIAVGYEVGARLCDAASLRSKGFDHVNYLEIATAAALSKLLHFDRRQTVNAISMTIVPNVALRESRVGELSMWKGGAAANSSRNAAFAAIATASGFTAPSRPISGTLAFKKIVCQDLEESVFRRIGKPKAILRTYIKKYPVEYHAQSAVDMSLILSSRVKGKDIRSVTVETYEAGRSILADPEKWHPRNRETADHSLPFVVAAALSRGDFWLGTYSLAGNRKLEQLMGLVEVVEREDFTKQYAETLPTSITVRTSAGDFTEAMAVPKGHWKNPMSDAEIESKFVRLSGNKKLLPKLWNMENMRVTQLVKSTGRA